MSTLVTDYETQRRLRAERRAVGVDLYDEVWKGIYCMTPMPNVEHLRLVARLVAILEAVVADAGLGEVFPGVNLSPVGADWEQDFRIPDVAVFLKRGSALNCESHWEGPADFLLEICSPGDATRDKVEFYSQLGVKELLIIEREPWALELHRPVRDRLALASRSVVDGGGILVCQTVGLQFQLISGQSRPGIQVATENQERTWVS